MLYFKNWINHKLCLLETEVINNMYILLFKSNASVKNILWINICASHLEHDIHCYCIAFF